MQLGEWVHEERKQNKMPRLICHTLVLLLRNRPVSVPSDEHNEHKPVADSSQSHRRQLSHRQSQNLRHPYPNPTNPHPTPPPEKGNATTQATLEALTLDELGLMHKDISPAARPSLLCPLWKLLQCRMLFPTLRYCTTQNPIVRLRKIDDCKNLLSQASPTGHPL